MRNTQRIRRRPLYRSRGRFPDVPRRITIIGTLLLIFAPAFALTNESGKPYEQDFIITAYYSPLPDQCCYVLGSEIADKILNGEGVRGADGTGVYPGMIAAPPSYAFGTRIALPGIGVVTVHDRGGAIQEASGGHRLDLWAGYGEEGLARALAFGVKRVRGTVYPQGSPEPRERIALEALTAPLERLRPFYVLDHGLLDARPKVGQIGLSVVMLQEHLRDLGYFAHDVTGKFGEVTQQGLARFLREVGLDGHGDALMERSAAYLVATHRLGKRDVPAPMIGPESSAEDIAAAQRMLRFLGLYRGRSDGTYGPALRDAVIAFQQSRSLVGDGTSPGAGRIGPLTRGALTQAWKQSIIARHAERLLLLRRTIRHLEDRGRLVEGFLREGKTGPAVRVYQELLAARGFFPAEKINGVFGPLTKESTARYQLAVGLIKRASDEGAGDVGPLTLRKLRSEEVREALRMVRAYGWQVL